MHTPRRVLFLVASTRPGGNTEQLAQRAAAALPPGTEQEWVRLAEVDLPPFEDLRHAGAPFPEPQGAAARLLEQTLAATDVVFVAPTYWYSLPAVAKLYLDHWSGWMRLPGRDFRAHMAHKTLWAITVNTDDVGEVGSSAPLLETLRLSAGYFGMRFGGAVVGHGSRPRSPRRMRCSCARRCARRSTEAGAACARVVRARIEGRAPGRVASTRAVTTAPRA